MTVMVKRMATTLKRMVIMLKLLAAMLCKKQISFLDICKGFPNEIVSNCRSFVVSLELKMN